MSWTRKRKALSICFGVYVFLWALTATWGISDVDRAFDREFAVGVTGFGTHRPEIPIPRISQMANIKDLMDSANNLPEEPGLFRFRTNGMAVAPFVIIDEAAAVFAPLGGHGGRRLVLWIFGATRWWPLKTYWEV